MINGRCPATMCCIALVLGIVGTPIWEAIANDVIGSKELVQTPQWLILGGTYRIRHELQDGRFREDRTGGDQALVERLLLNVRVDPGWFYLGGEFENTRAHLDDKGTPIGTDDVNTL